MNFKLAFLCLFYGFITLVGHGQNQAKADSVKRLIESGELQFEERLEAVFWLSTYSISPEEKLNHAIKLLEMAINSNQTAYIIKAKCRIGVAHRYLGNLGTALKYLFESANDAIGLEDQQAFLAEIYAEISTCYTQNGDSENALIYNSKAINILRQTGNDQELAISLLNTGYDYYLIENYDSAMAYYNESEPIFRRIGMDLGLAYITGNRALVFWKQGNSQKAKQDLFRAIEMLKPMADVYGMSDYFNQLARIYIQENAFNEALNFANQSLLMAKAEGLKEQIRDSYYLMSKSLEEMEDYKNAMWYQKQYFAYKDSIQNLETTQRLANLRTEFEVGQKQVEVDVLLEQRRVNQLIMIAGGVVLVFFVVLMAIIYSYAVARKKLNKQLEEQKDALLLLNQTKDKFFSIISHDLRGPVNSLYGLSKVSGLYLNEGRVEDANSMISRMGESIDRLTNLLDDLLNWALQQRGHFPYSPEKLALIGLLNDVLDMFKEAALAKKINLSYEGGEEMFLFVDKQATSTIFRNLLNNAIKFTPKGGSITISSKKEDQMAVISVRDSGVGIPKEKLEELFNFEQTMSTKGTSGEVGLGLGLQLVSEFITLNEGKIEVESEPTKGTTFIVRLPLAKD